MSSGELRDAVVPRERSSMKTWLAAAAGVSVMALAAILLDVARTPTESMPRLVNPVQVTSAAGLEDYPTWSPDGETVAFESTQDGNADVWVARVGGQAVNRTSDYTGFDGTPSWSPDGRYLAFWSGREGGGYFLMPAIGGVPRSVARSAVPLGAVRPRSCR